MKKISAKAFDAKADAGEDIDEFVDWTKMRRPGRETRRVNVDFLAGLSKPSTAKPNASASRGRRS